MPGHEQLFKGPKRLGILSEELAGPGSSTTGALPLAGKVVLPRHGHPERPGLPSLRLGLPQLPGHIEEVHIKQRR